MTQPVLYLLIGYPGAGKTSVAKIIAEQTGAIHLWADVERHKMFDQPSHSEQESRELYNHLNDLAAQYLSEGKSVVFDTNFNFHSDRQKLSQIAADHGAETLTIWLTTPVEVARSRAVCEHEKRNGYDMTMSDEQFDAIVSKLEPPSKDEKIIKIDGTKLDTEELTKLLQANGIPAHG